MTLRDIMAVGFRQHRLIAGTFAGILSISVATGFLIPRQYVAEMKILVRPESLEPVVSPEHGASLQWQAAVSEEELRSEAELIKSRGVLSRVVVECGLENFGKVVSGDAGTNEQKVARGLLAMEKDLTVEPIKQTNMIRVSYKSGDPQVAATVLNALATMYVQKHLQMHRALNQLEFFHEQAEEHRKALAKDEEGLINFDREQGVVNPGLEKEMTLRKLAEFGVQSRTARASIAEIEQRIGALEAQLANPPKRETKEMRGPEDPEILQRLKSRLLELEARRPALLAEFKPTDHIVKETDEEIAQVRTAIESSEKSSLQNETADRDPTYEALRTELARAKTELAAKEARAAAVSSQTQAYRTEGEQLERQEFRRQDMSRAKKADEDNYLLYLHKEEEARIADAAERQRFSNVVVEPATAPLKPQNGRLWFATLGAVVAAFVSTVLAFFADRWDPSFRTPKEVESFLGSPVVAAIPKSAD